MPDKAPIAAARVKVRLPDILVLMPTKRAPRRLTAVARKARPYKVLPKNIHKPTTSKAQVPSTQTDCATKLTAPNSTRPETRRVGTECVRPCRYRWQPDKQKKKQNVVGIK